jgi:peptidoglycan/xylan/chitin deacetylase (PgdA/CDA1 family)
MSDEIANFALPRAQSPGVPLSGRIAGKVSRFLARNARTKTLAVRNATPIVTFTFDDVPASACRNGAAILEQHHARGTFYVSGGGCGAASPGGRLATTAQLDALCASGHEVGCHTYSHPAVSAVAHDELIADLERNRRFLEGINCAIAVRNFAYPYGDLSFPTKRYLETRFDSCRSLLRGVNEGRADLGALKTCPLENATIDRQGIRAFIARAAKAKGWLIFSSHDVAEEPSRFGVTPDLFAFAVAASRDAGCRLATIAEGLVLMATPKSRDRTLRYASPLTPTGTMIQAIRPNATYP